MTGITGFAWRKGGGLLSQLKASKKKPKKKKRHSMREWQFSHLYALIDAEIKHKTAPNPPRKWQQKFAQPEYKSLKEKKLKKLRKLIRKHADSK
jgi:hypothetical protein